MSRYTRGLRPGDPKSLPQFLDGELLKLQQALDTPEDAIPDDASGAVNQATVNAILAALRAWGIIKT